MSVLLKTEQRPPGAAERDRGARSVLVRGMKLKKKNHK